MDELIDQLQRVYKAVLLQISRKLGNYQKEELRFYCSDLIGTKEDTGALDILRSLQDTGKVSWEELSFLKEALRVIQRIDIVKSLTAFDSGMKSTQSRDLGRVCCDVIQSSKLEVVM